MFKPQDRFIFHDGVCALQRMQGSNMTCTCKGAVVDRVILDVLHEQLKRELKCNIEVVHGAGAGFSFIFRSEAKLVSGMVPPSFYISNAPVNIRRSNADQAPIEDLRPLVNDEGAEMVGWILMTVYGEAFDYEPGPGGLYWKPARRPSRITPV
ncbi:MAG: hypothetical protein WA001_01290 [Patescibacteria group bacterium]